MIRAAYDFDGVLAVGPPPNEIPWGKMNGSQRARRRLWLLDWYATAPRIYDPPEERFWVISARKEDPEVRSVSARWLLRNYRGRAVGLSLLSEARTTENAVRFKAGIIVREGFTDFTEDNLQVVRGVARALPSCRVWLFKDGAPTGPVVVSRA